jgi:hypothetical protein
MSCAFERSIKRTVLRPAWYGCPQASFKLSHY